MKYYFIHYVSIPIDPSQRALQCNMIEKGDISDIIKDLKAYADEDPHYADYVITFFSELSKKDYKRLKDIL